MSGPRLLVLLRHGATAESAQGLFSGRADVPLSPTGEEQARRWAPVLAPLAGDLTAWTSPLVRAARTADLAGLTPRVAPELMEWDLGSLEGRRADEVRTATPGWSLFVDGPPESTGESPGAVAVRARTALDTLLTAPTEIAMGVAHGQFLRALTVTALGLDLAEARRLSFGPARAAVIVRRAGGRLSLAGWNVPPAAGLLDDLT